MVSLHADASRKREGLIGDRKQTNCDLEARRSLAVRGSSAPGLEMSDV